MGSAGKVARLERVRAAAAARQGQREGASAAAYSDDECTPLSLAGRRSTLAQEIAAQPDRGAAAVATAAGFGVDVATPLVQMGAALPDIACRSPLATALAAEVHAVPTGLCALQHLAVRVAGETARLERARAAAAHVRQQDGA